jgi:hypothetical protein
VTDEHHDKPEMDEPRSEPGAATPEGYTKEEPAATEIGELGTPGAGMTADAPHAADADLVEHGDAPADAVTDSTADEHVAHHDAVTHMDAHTTLSDDDHGHAAVALGPIDWGKWAYAIVGAIGGLIVIAFFIIAVGGIPK